MDEQKKQQMIVGILIAAVLGAGSYYVFFRDTGEDETINVATGPTVRKQRGSTETKKARTTRKVRGRKVADAPRVTTRKVRERSENTGPTIRKTRRGASNRVKKKKLLPMG